MTEFSKKIIQSILENNFISAKKYIDEALETKAISILLEEKKNIGLLITENQKKAQRHIHYIKNKVIGGKLVGKRLRRSAKKGYKIVNGKYVRMSPSEKLHRITGARKAKHKKFIHRARTQRNIKRALEKRKRLGY